MNWLAEQVGISKTHMSKIVNGTRTVAEPDAKHLAALVGADVRVLFECPMGDGKFPSVNGEKAA